MKSVIVIAEAGVNHNGDIKLAKQLIDEAANCGVDYIKFQTFITELIVDKSAPKAEYQNSTIGAVKSQFDMIKELELSFDDFLELQKYCIQRGVKFLTSVADLKSLSRLHELKVDFVKVSSGEVANPIFLKAVSKLNKPVILSTGMATLGEIENALAILTSSGLSYKDITVLHCNTEYPTPMEDVNLSAMLTIKEAFKVNVGYSDHTLGIEVPIAAVAMGATVIEKHFTIDKTMTGPDHACSLEPHEFTEMVRSIRNIQLALGNGIKQPSRSEQKNIPVVRKSIFSSKKINQGQTFTEENLTVKRPGDGIPAMDIDRIINKEALQDIEPGTKLNYSLIKW